MKKKVCTFVVRNCVGMSLFFLAGFVVCEMAHLKIEHLTLADSIRAFMLERDASDCIERSQESIRRTDRMLSSLAQEEQKKCLGILSSLSESRRYPSARRVFDSSVNSLTNGMQWTRWRYDWERGVEMDGVANDAADVYDFKTALDRSDCFANVMSPILPPVTNNQQRFRMEADLVGAKGYCRFSPECLSDDTMEILLSTPVVEHSKLWPTHVIRDLHKFLEQRELIVQQLKLSEPKEELLGANLWYFDYDVEVVVVARNEKSIPVGSDIELPVDQAVIRRADLKRLNNGQIECRFVFAVRGFGRLDCRDAHGLHDDKHESKEDREHDRKRQAAQLRAMQKELQRLRGAHEKGRK